ncbi:hypothetical protein [Mogibacterium timidum]|uniref:hypothetical protein n=1 Tax=Mogibacterium timidum TaxID=35519 RepID=UPI00235405CF|nr:hypothetical protein [Mogibacterium timidum]
MKKIWSVLLAAVMMLSLAACGSSNNNTSESSKKKRVLNLKGKPSLFIIPVREIQRELQIS